MLTHLRPQRMDQRVLLLVRKTRKVGKRRQRFHPQVESIQPKLVNSNAGFIRTTSRNHAPRHPRQKMAASTPG